MNKSLLRTYCLYDTCVGEYGQLFHAIHHEDCKRKLAVSQRSNPFLGDLKLFYVGDFEVDTGHFNSINPEFVCNLSDICSPLEVNNG